MSNLYAQFLELLPNRPVQIGVVAQVSDGSATLDVVGGGTTVVRGTASVGAKVYFRDGIVEGLAPDLPTYNIEV